MLRLLILMKTMQTSVFLSVRIKHENRYLFVIGGIIFTITVFHLVSFKVHWLMIDLLKPPPSLRNNPSPHSMCPQISVGLPLLASNNSDSATLFNSKF